MKNYSTFGNIGKKYNAIRSHMKTAEIEKKLSEMIESMLMTSICTIGGHDNVRNIAICELYQEVKNKN
jgi:hypothetical protein